MHFHRVTDMRTGEVIVLKHQTVARGKRGRLKALKPLTRIHPWIAAKLRGAR